MAGKNEDIDVGLSEEERAAIADDTDLEEQEAGGAEADAAGSDADPKAGAVSTEISDDDPKPAGDAKPEPETKAEPKSPGEDAAQQGAAAARDDRAFVPRFEAQAPERYDERKGEISTALEALKTERREIREKLSNGDISIEEYDEAIESIEDRRGALKDEQRDLDLAKREAERAATANADMARQRWEWDVERFLGGNEAFRNPILYSALGAALQTLTQSEDNKGKSNGWFLEEAAKQVRKAFGGPGGEAPKIPASDSPPNPGKASSRRDEIPQTLGDLPSAGEDVPSGDEFAAIDRLNGMDFEAALMRMSEAQRERYLDTRKLHS